MLWVFLVWNITCAARLWGMKLVSHLVFPYAFAILTQTHVISLTIYRVDLILGNSNAGINHSGCFPQVQWSGRVTEGAGLSTGETTELANSYMSRLGPVTRNKEASGTFLYLFLILFVSNALTLLWPIFYLIHQALKTHCWNIKKRNKILLV
mgnify:CR=1 FL=1